MQVKKPSNHQFSCTSVKKKLEKLACEPDSVIWFLPRIFHDDQVKAKVLEIKYLHGFIQYLLNKVSFMYCSS